MAISKRTRSGPTSKRRPHPSLDWDTSDRVGYRRFSTSEPELAGVRSKSARIRGTHAKVLSCSSPTRPRRRLRIDHPGRPREPARIHSSGFFFFATAARLRIWIEKILDPEEAPPQTGPSSGERPSMSSANDSTALLFVDPAAEQGRHRLIRGEADRRSGRPSRRSRRGEIAIARPRRSRGFESLRRALPARRPRGATRRARYTHVRRGPNRHASKRRPHRVHVAADDLRRVHPLAGERSRALDESE